MVFIKATATNEDSQTNTYYINPNNIVCISPNTNNTTRIDFMDRDYINANETVDELLNQMN